MQAQKEASIPQMFCSLFPSGVRHEDCSVCTFHRRVLQRPRLRPKTRVNREAPWVLGMWGQEAEAVFQVRND